MGRLRRVFDAVAERGPERIRFGELPALTGSERADAAMTICALVYRGVTSSELDEPVTRLADRMCADVVFVGTEIGCVHAVEPSREVRIDATPETAPPTDVLVVPGGLGWKAVIGDARLESWLRRAAGEARGILAISTGSLLLASVGRLDGRRATGHWLAADELAALGASVTADRTASDEAGRVVTTAGALAAIQVIDELADRARWAEWMP